MPTVVAQIPDLQRVLNFCECQDDDGFILFESRAISRYLSAAHANGKLIPKGTKESAIFEQAVSIEQANFDPFVTVLARERFYQ